MASKNSTVPPFSPARNSFVVRSVIAELRGRGPTKRLLPSGGGGNVNACQADAITAPRGKQPVINGVEEQHRATVQSGAEFIRRPLSDRGIEREGADETFAAVRWWW